MKTKILILSVFLSVLLLFSNLSVKANEVVFPAFPEPVEGKSSTHYFIFYQPGYNKYTLIKPLNPNDMYVTEDFDGDALHYGGPVLSYEWREGETAWNEYPSSGQSGSIRTLYREGPGRVELLYSSFTLLYEDGSIFFQRAPIKANFLTQMKKVQMGATMKTVVYLIPLLIPLLVSFLAFRKALAVLLKVLRKA